MQTARQVLRGSPGRRSDINRAGSLLLTLFAILACGCQGPGNEADRIAQLDNAELKAPAFQSAIRTAFEKAPQSTDAGLMKMRAAGFARPEDSWGDIIGLWLAGEEGTLELLWWKKDDRQTRALIVALLWCTRPPPQEGSDWPQGIRNFAQDSTRFETAERELRIEETRFVRQHLGDIARQLVENLRRIDTPRARALLKQCQGSAN